jgi:hypothetical protein
MNEAFRLQCFVLAGMLKNKESRFVHGRGN